MVLVMDTVKLSAAEIRIGLTNRRDGYDRQVDEATEAAYMFEAAANGDGVGHSTAAKCFEFAQAHANRAERYKRMSAILTAALAYIPETETENAL